MKGNKIRVLAGLAAALVLAVSAPVLVGTDAVAQSKGKTDDITINITHIKALDVIDWGLAGDADFYAKVTIAGETQSTQRVRGKNEIRPDWKITKAVPRGKHDVRIEILDKDPLKPDDRIDINRVDKKRDLEFTVDTRNCRVGGFSNGYSCGDKITRAGAEKKKAEIDFKVSVKR